MPEQRYLLVKGRAGLGDRILCALGSLVVARRTGRVPVVDWSDPVYSQDGSNVFARFFHCPEAAGLDALPAGDSVAPAIWRGRLATSSRGLERAHPELGSRRFARESSIDPAGPDCDARVAVLWHFGSPVALAPERLAAMLRRDLLLVQPIRERVEGFRARELAGRTVGVHIRASDLRVRVRAILAELDALLAREPGLGAFAATDNAEVRDLLARRYPGVVMTPHWYPPAGAPPHNDPGCPNRTENGVEALVDLHLLGGCDTLIGDTTSAFTRVAGLLLDEQGSLIDVRPAPNGLRRLSRRAWQRYRAQDSAAARAVHRGAAALGLSNLPARAHARRAFRGTAGRDTGRRFARRPARP